LTSPASKGSDEHYRSREGRSAKRMLLDRLRRQPVIGARDWTRDELYDE
jgi:hypothetical protein